MNKFISVAKKTAYKAGEYLKKRSKSSLVIKRKRGDKDVVTDADLSVQKLIVNEIIREFPDHKILAEESQNNPAEYSGFVWVIDPIDGTSAFSSGLPTYSSSIALLKNRKPIVGAIYLAISDEVAWSVLGKGSFINNNKLTVKRIVHMRQSFANNSLRVLQYFSNMQLNKRKQKRRAAALLVIVLNKCCFYLQVSSANTDH